MTAGRQRAFAALYYAARGLESAAAGLYHAAAGLMTHADLHAAITEEWRRFPSSEEPSDASLFDWEKAFYARFLERTDKILLVGCGTGRDLIALLQCGHRVDGVDLVREAVVRAATPGGTQVRRVSVGRRHRNNRAGGALRRVRVLVVLFTPTFRSPLGGSGS